MKEINKSINETKKKSITKSKPKTKLDSFVPTKPLNNLKHFYEFIDKDSKSTEKSDINDDSWIKGKKEDFLRPMFKNLPDKDIRPSYNVLTTGKMITLFGTQGRIIGIKNGKLLLNVMDDKTNEFEIIKYDMEKVLTELKKRDKKNK